MHDLAKNVLGGLLQPCSVDPMTGFFRTGDCQVTEEDVGNHGVCIVATAEFLAFSRSRGNDLSTPHPEFEFPGVKPGQRWCLCSARWQEALQAGKAPHRAGGDFRRGARGHATCLRRLFFSASEREGGDRNEGEGELGEREAGRMGSG